MTYRTTCPKCEGPLMLFSCVVWDIEGVWIERDGFSVSDAKRFSTSDERVRCRLCKWIGDLETEDN